MLCLPGFPLAFWIKNCSKTNHKSSSTNHFKPFVMAKYGKKSQEKVEEAMKEMKEGKLKTGTGKKVTSRKQAIAIGLSEAREEGDKVPKKPSAKKSAPKKSASKKSK